jgi:hypothetical protein
MNGLSITDYLGALTHLLESLSAEMQAILQHISPMEQILSTYKAVSRYSGVGCKPVEGMAHCLGDK